MASIKLSGIISDIRGKLNGSYFAKRKNITVMSTNRGGKLTKADAGRTALQRSQLAIGTTAKNWQGLSTSVKSQWSAYASTKTWFSKTGEPYTPTGYEVYTQQCLNVVNFGNPPLQTFSEPTVIQDVDACDLYVLDDIAFIAQNDNPITATGVFLVYMSGPNSKGTLYPYGGLKKMGLYSVSWGQATRNITPDYLSTYGAFPYNSRVFYKLTIVDFGSGYEFGTKSGYLDIGAPPSLNPPPIIDPN